MGNYFQQDAQARKAGLPRGTSLGKYKKDLTYTPSEKQIKFHADLMAFLKEHDVPLFKGIERPRNKSAYNTAINTMKTLLRKHGLEDEFFGRKETEK